MKFRNIGATSYVPFFYLHRLSKGANLELAHNIVPAIDTYDDKFASTQMSNEYVSSTEQYRNKIN